MRLKKSTLAAAISAFDLSAIQLLCEEDEVKN